MISLINHGSTKKQYIKALFVVEIQGGMRQYLSLVLRESEPAFSSELGNYKPDKVFEKSYKIPYALGQLRQMLFKIEGFRCPGIFREPGVPWYSLENNFIGRSKHCYIAF